MGHMGNFGGFGNGYGYGVGPGNGFGYGMMGGGFGFTSLLFLVLIGFLIYLLFKKGRPQQNFSGKQDNTFNANTEALEIAKLRYVRGEISYDEYQEIVKVLQ